MQSTLNPLSDVIAQLKKMPGVGEKSAQRLAFFFLSLPPNEVHEFAKTLVETRQAIKYCDKCFNISLNTTCHICSDPRRETQKCCVVAEPKDIFALERSSAFRGGYHVLGGLLSPIDGIHPELLRIKELVERLKTEPITELILAINPSIEGDATMLYLQSVLETFPITITKLAYGLPMGSDIDYADEMTLQKALAGRQKL